VEFFCVFSFVLFESLYLLVSSLVFFLGHFYSSRVLFLALVVYCADTAVGLVQLFF